MLEDSFGLGIVVDFLFPIMYVRCLINKEKTPIYIGCGNVFFFSNFLFVFYLLTQDSLTLFCYLYCRKKKEDSTKKFIDKIRTKKSNKDNTSHCFFYFIL